VRPDLVRARLRDNIDRPPTCQTAASTISTTGTMSNDCKLDRIDLRILAQLQKRGRITNVELADAVGLSPSPCLIRVKRLEKAGYIVGYGAQIQLEKLGDVQVVFTEVTLADHRREDFIKFVNAVKDVDEIVECHLASGGYDYLLKFVTRSVGHYQSIIEGLLERDIGIEKYFSYVVIKTAFVKSHYPLETLFSSGSGAH
jgi:DNA-binding Lrp family transcriptional regulator